MQALDLLLHRQSNPHLTEPAPNSDQLAQILAAGMRVPDHGALQPWHFTVIQEQGLQKLADIFVNARKLEHAEQSKIDKAASMSFRAPLIIMITTNYQAHDKIPEKEQLITAGCCAHAMQMAATVLGYGAMWRTGDLSRNADVKQALAIDSKQDIVGFLYIGTEKKSLAVKPNKALDGFVSYL